jgi:hypothetical protein
MPTYTHYIGLQVLTHVQAGINNPGTRKASFIAATNANNISRAFGVHGLTVPDGIDANAVEIQVPRGAGDAGAWVDTPRPKVTPAQAQAAQAQGKAKAK